MALKRVWIPSPNYSSRGGTAVRLIVLHTAEGARTYESLAAYFQGPVSASSHVGIDDKPGQIGEYVSRPNKAWTQAEYNPACVSAELCGFASWTTDEWTSNHPNILANCAAWIAEEAAAFGIPITKLTASQAQGTGRGVCQHVDLGSGGGGHYDCGNLPIDDVLDMARTGSTTPTPPTPEPITEDDMITTATSKDGRVFVFVEKTDGRVFRAYQKDNGDWGTTDDGKSILWQPMGTPGK